MILCDWKMITRDNRIKCGISFPTSSMKIVSSEKVKISGSNGIGFRVAEQQLACKQVLTFGLRNLDIFSVLR